MGRAPAGAGRSQSEKEARQLRYSKLVRSDQPSCGNLADRWPLVVPCVTGGWKGGPRSDPAPAWGRFSAARDMKRLPQLTPFFTAKRACAARSESDGPLTPTPSCYPSIDGQHDSGQCTFSRFPQARLVSLIRLTVHIQVPRSTSWMTAYSIPRYVIRKTPTKNCCLIA